MSLKPSFEVLASLPDKIKVSARLVDYTIDLLENLETEDLSPDILPLYGYVLHTFNMKKARHEFRGACAKFICNQDGNERFDAYMSRQLRFDDSEPF